MSEEVSKLPIKFYKVKKEENVSKELGTITFSDDNIYVGTGEDKIRYIPTKSSDLKDIPEIVGDNKVLISKNGKYELVDKDTLVDTSDFSRVKKFTDLTDTPSGYTAGKILKVKDDNSGLEFIDIPKNSSDVPKGTKNNQILVYDVVSDGYIAKDICEAISICQVKEKESYPICLESIGKNIAKFSTSSMSYTANKIYLRIPYYLIGTKDIIVELDINNEIDMSGGGGPTSGNLIFTVNVYLSNVTLSKDYRTVSSSDYIKIADFEKKIFIDMTKMESISEEVREYFSLLLTQFLSLTKVSGVGGGDHTFEIAFNTHEIVFKKIVVRVGVEGSISTVTIEDIEKKSDYKGKTFKKIKKFYDGIYYVTVEESGNDVQYYIDTNKDIIMKLRDNHSYIIIPTGGFYEEKQETSLTYYNPESFVVGESDISSLTGESVCGDTFSSLYPAFVQFNDTYYASFLVQYTNNKYNLYFIRNGNNGLLETPKTLEFMQESVKAKPNLFGFANIETDVDMDRLLYEISYHWFIHEKLYIANSQFPLILILPLKNGKGVRVFKSGYLLFSKYNGSTDYTKTIPDDEWYEDFLFPDESGNETYNVDIFETIHPFAFQKYYELYPDMVNNPQTMTIDDVERTLKSKPEDFNSMHMLVENKKDKSVALYYFPFIGILPLLSNIMNVSVSEQFIKGSYLYKPLQISDWITHGKVLQAVREKKLESTQGLFKYYSRFSISNKFYMGDKKLEFNLCKYIPKQSKDELKKIDDNPDSDRPKSYEEDIDSGNYKHSTSGSVEQNAVVTINYYSAVYSSATVALSDCYNMVTDYWDTNYTSKPNLAYYYSAYKQYTLGSLSVNNSTVKKNVLYPSIYEPPLEYIVSNNNKLVNIAYDRGHYPSYRNFATVLGGTYEEHNIIYNYVPKKRFIDSMYYKDGIIRYSGDLAHIPEITILWLLHFITKGTETPLSESFSTPDNFKYGNSGIKCTDSNLIRLAKETMMYAKSSALVGKVTRKKVIELYLTWKGNAGVNDDILEAMSNGSLLPCTLDFYHKHRNTDIMKDIANYIRCSQYFTMSDNMSVDYMLNMFEKTYQYYLKQCGNNRLLVEENSMYFSDALKSKLDLSHPIEYNDEFKDSLYGNRKGLLVRTIKARNDSIVTGEKLREAKERPTSLLKDESSIWGYGSGKSWEYTRYTNYALERVSVTAENVETVTRRIPVNSSDKIRVSDTENYYLANIGSNSKLYNEALDLIQTLPKLSQTNNYRFLKIISKGNDKYIVGFSSTVAVGAIEYSHQGHYFAFKYGVNYNTLDELPIWHSATYINQSFYSTNYIFGIVKGKIVLVYTTSGRNGKGSYNFATELKVQVDSADSSITSNTGSSFYYVRQSATDSGQIDSKALTKYTQYIDSLEEIIEDPVTNDYRFRIIAGTTDNLNNMTNSEYQVTQIDFKLMGDGYIPPSTGLPATRTSLYIQPTDEKILLTRPVKEDNYPLKWIDNLSLKGMIIRKYTDYVLFTEDGYNLKALKAGNSVDEAYDIGKIPDFNEWTREFSLVDRDYILWFDYGLEMGRIYVTKINKTNPDRLTLEHLFYIQKDFPDWSNTKTRIYAINTWFGTIVSGTDMYPHKATDNELLFYNANGSSFLDAIVLKKE